MCDTNFDKLIYSDSAQANLLVYILMKRKVHDRFHKPKQTLCALHHEEKIWIIILSAKYIFQCKYY
jgi:hypothetical protein